MTDPRPSRLSLDYDDLDVAAGDVAADVDDEPEEGILARLLSPIGVMTRSQAALRGASFRPLPPTLMIDR